jgi:hypothetical protein
VLERLQEAARDSCVSVEHYLRELIDDRFRELADEPARLADQEAQEDSAREAEMVRQLEAD